MRRALNLFAKNIPLLTKKIAIFTILYTHHHVVSSKIFVNCASNHPSLKQNIENIQQKTIKINENGRLIAHAYCFAQNYLVVVSQQLLDKGKNNKNYEYYSKGEKLKGNFKVIGSFQNLTFIQCTLSKKISPILGYFGQPDPYTQIEILKQKEFLSLKRGFFITEDSGYGIIDGEGQTGSLVTNNQGVAGIVVQVGGQTLKGFLRIIEWRHLLPILRYVKGKSMHLGISAQAMQNHEGVSVVRIAPNSPFKHEIMMGDIILRANGHRFRDPESLQRICIESEGQVNLVIQREDKQVQTKIRL